LNQYNNQNYNASIQNYRIQQVPTYNFTNEKMQQLLLKPIGNQKSFNPENLKVVVLKEQYNYQQKQNHPDCASCTKEMDGTEVCKILNCKTSICGDCIGTILECPICKSENCFEEYAEENSEIVYEAETEENPVYIPNKIYYNS